MKEKGSKQFDVTFELVTPEMVNERKNAFLKAIAGGQTTEERLMLGTKCVFGDLIGRYRKTSVMRLSSEIMSRILVLSLDEERKSAINAHKAYEILSSREKCVQLFSDCGVLRKIKYYSEDTAGKLDLGILQDDLSLQESIGRVLRHLPKIKKMLFDTSNPVRFIQLDQCERGLVGLLDYPDKPTVIKRTNPNEIGESKIAKFCAEHHLSPIIYESTPDEIAEEFIIAPKINSFKDNPEMVGYAIGLMMRKLHAQKVVYDNRFLDHVCVEYLNEEKTKARTRIIDLEAATFSQNFELDMNKAILELKRFYSNSSKGLNTALNSLGKGYKGIE